MTRPGIEHSGDFHHVAPMSCACGRTTDGALCYRCRIPICRRCEKFGGGWCGSCNEREAKKRPAHWTLS